MYHKETQQRFRQRRKDNGLCLHCGKPLDRNGVDCQSCRDKINAEIRQTRKWYQDNGICPRCRTNKLYGNEKNCLDCSTTAYIVEMNNRDKEKYNKNHAEWSKRTHQEMIAKGICTRCRKRNVDNGYKTCGICRAKDRQYKRIKYGKPDRSERHTKGLCFFCNSPIKKGYKVCDQHYELNVKNARSQKANMARQELKKQGVIY